jgi:gluconokinase
MGVAGSGKSSVGARVASLLDWTLVEADDHHSARNKQKMLAGLPLDDEDRGAWLDALLNELRNQLALGHDVVLLCSALKRRYRDVFRAAFPGAPFVYLKITQQEAYARVMARSASHDFPASLVASQFAALETPQGEAAVLAVDASRPLADVCQEIAIWAADLPLIAAPALSSAGS